MARVKVDENIQYDDVRKLYYVTLSFGKDINGKRVRTTKTFTSKREAIKYRNDNKVEIKEAEWQVSSSKTTLSEYMDYYFKHCVNDLEETTLYGYRQMWRNHIEPALGDLMLSKISPQRINQYYSQAISMKKLTSNTVRKHHDFLSKVFKTATREGVLKLSPMSGVTPPKVEVKEIVAYTADQLYTLIDLAVQSKIYIPVMLGAHLGLRRGEICGLKWNQVDLENRVITISKTMTQAGSKVVIKGTKTKRSTRKMGINDDLYLILKNEIERQRRNKEELGSAYKDFGYVFCWDDGVPYRPNYLSDRFTHLIETNGLPSITLHGLRHTWVSLGIDEGVPTNVVSRGAGHSSQNVTDRIYTHKLRDVDERPTTAILQALERARKKDT